MEPWLLTTVDPAAGTATEVGPFDAENIVDDNGANLAFDKATGTLWLVDSLGQIYTVDTATGAATATGDEVTVESGGEQIPIPELVENLAINSVCAPVATTTTASTTTTSTVPAAQPAQPVRAQPTFTG